MAIITIARQIGALGDEVAAEIARQTGYRFINRKLLESKLMEYGLSEQLLKKYDEKKPGFIASMVRDRDVYLNYLLTAVYEAAMTGNCILLGRGAWSILSDVPDVLRIRLVAPDSVRSDRLMKEHTITQKQALQLIATSDTNRAGFHRAFFNCNVADPANYQMVLNTGLLSESAAAEIIATFAKGIGSHDYSKLIAAKLTGQRIVNHVLFDLNLPVHFLESIATVDCITLHGVAPSVTAIDSILDIANSMADGLRIESSITMVQDYKTFQ